MVNKQKILIVDDKKENLLALGNVLADLDVEIVEAVSGNEALAATLDHDFAVVILDVMMPGMDGYELAGYLKGDAKTRNIPIIFLTAVFSEEDRIFKGYEVGAVDYIVKPYNPAVLNSKVRVFLELDRARAQLAEKIDALTASEQALRESESLYRAIARNFPDGAVYIFDHDLRFRVADGQAMAALGFSRQGLEGKTIWEGTDEEICRILEKRYPRVLAGETLHFETPLNGRVFSSAYVPIRDEHESVIAGMVVSHDITERKKYEEQLQQLNETLEQRVAERTKLAEDRAKQLRTLFSELTLAEQRERMRLSKILHDGLQQLLAAAKMRIAYFADKVRDPDSRQEAHDIEAILNDSMQMSRSLSVELSPPVLQQAGLAAGLEWLARWMRDRHNFNVELSIEAQPELPEDITIMVFESVRELLFNAVKHAKVSWARVSVQQDGNSGVRIDVSDEGRGFDPSKVSSMESSAGGLGLFSIRERIDSIGGRFEIDSAPGKGCRFTLLVPGAAHLAPAYPEKRDSGSPEGNPKAANIRVLLVDDHALFRDGIGGILNQEPDIEVVGYAKDGQEAIDLTKKLIPNLILMDIGMPGVDGIEATRAICRESAAVRVIGLSIYEDEERNRALLDAGAVGYKSKGCAPAELISAIRDCMNR